MAWNLFLLNPHSSLPGLVLVPGPGAAGPSGVWGGAPMCCFFVAEGRRPDGVCAGRGKGGGGPPAGQAPRPPLRGLVLAARDGGRGAGVSPAAWLCGPVRRFMARRAAPRSHANGGQPSTNWGTLKIERAGTAFYMAFFLGVDLREVAR